MSAPPSDGASLGRGAVVAPLSAVGGGGRETSGPSGSEQKSWLGVSSGVGVVGLLTEGLARTENILEAVPEGVETVLGGISRLMGGLEKVVGGLFGGARMPAGGMPPVGSGPAIPPPAPVSYGCPTTPGPSFEGSGACGGAAGKLLGQFAVLSPFSVAVPQINEVTWLVREPLRPSSSPRPPNERPG